MKINIKKFARAIPYFLTVFAVVLACTVQVSATAQYIDPYKYITGTETSGSIEYVNISFTGVMPKTWFVSGNSETEMAGKEYVDYTVDMSSPYFKTWLIGVAPTTTYAPDGSIRVAEIMAGSTMELTSSFNFTFEHSISGYGGFFEMYYRGLVYCYDSDGKYMHFVSGSALEWSEQLVGSATVSKEYSMTFDLPSGCAYICPVSNLTITADVPNAGDDYWSVMMDFEAEHFGMTVVRDSFASNSQNNQEIVDRLDDIINGSVEDNQTAQNAQNKAENAGNDLQNAGDALNALGTPSVNVDALVPTELGGQIYLRVSELISILWTQSTIGSMLTFLGGFMVLSYLLYGKKG